MLFFFPSFAISLKFHVLIQQSELLLKIITYLKGRSLFVIPPV